MGAEHKESRLRTWTQYIQKNVELEEAIAVIALLFATVLATYLGSKRLATNPDAIVSTYIFKGTPFPSGLLMADWHTNILKWPVAFLQSLFPYNLFTFTLVNFILMALMSLGWAYAGALAFGRRHFYQTTLVLALFTAGSNVVYSTAFTFTRNVEYPLFFLGILLFWKLVARQNNRTHKWWWFVTLYIVGLALLMINDPYFVYASTPALVIVLIWQGLSKKAPKLPFVSLLLAVAPFIFSEVLLRVLMKLHVFQYYGSQLNSPTHIINDIPLWTWGIFEDLAALFNAVTPFGNPPHLGEINSIFMLGLLVACLISFYIFAKKLPTLVKSNPAFATMLVSTIVLLILYVVVGGFEHQPRFLVLPSLVICTTLGVWMEPLLSRMSRSYLLTLVGACLIGTGCLMALTYRDVNSALQQLTRQDGQILSSIATNVHAHGANTVLSSYTYTTMLDFTSQGDLHTVPLLFCNQNLPFLTRLSWYQIHPYTSKTVALLVDKNGPDSGSWLCSINGILQYYGKPLSESTMPGLNGVNINIYYYPSSIINKVKVIKTPGSPVPDLS